MTLPSHLFEKYLTRFDELIEKGNELCNKVKEIPEPNPITLTIIRELTEEENNLLHEQITIWEIQYFSLIDKIIPSKSTHRSIIDDKNKCRFYTRKGMLKTYLSQLKGIKEDYVAGMFSDLALEIEAEIAADYMGQAEHLLTEDSKGKYNHVPAAVLAGAVLEKGLRTLCLKHELPVTVQKNDNSRGKVRFLSMGPLIQSLTKAGVFESNKGNQLTTWAGIRNSAAHGREEEFKKEDVESMIKGIKIFLDEYLQ
ncbi:hypothetical protein [Oscillatoria acuminata]|uniref:DUF4145 domain-containing protein n=1 Tax=Oscillatoria acuminata PCC 6304 TaxID=56110 RepID=K9TL62_9CYAN|nr:hypothetical protein [Oscillatoria acuminata]AFY82876.1 hypothetical protein Oscil6304_3301 [Oscillatoria acuminata PCC 6304]